MKKLFTLMLAMLMVMSLVGCSKKKSTVEINITAEDEVVYINLDEVGESEVRLNFGKGSTVDGEVDYKTAGTYTVTVTNGNNTREYKVIVGNTSEVEADKTARAEEKKRKEELSKPLDQNHVYSEKFYVTINGVEVKPETLHTIDYATAKEYVNQVFGGKIYEENGNIIWVKPDESWTCEEATMLVKCYQNGGHLSMGAFDGSVSNTTSFLRGCGLRD